MTEASPPADGRWRDVDGRALRRRPTAIRLSDAEERPVRELADTMPKLARGVPNLSEAIRFIIAEWNAGRGREQSEQRRDELVAARGRIERVMTELTALEKELT